ncbi:MAG: class I SAM-dependent RNA methyltransferase, partial [Lentisphaeria bacterium]|nr:class I SAM-dependent RNA methyltransferase [Lentisphaeria bacterium]
VAAILRAEPAILIYISCAADTLVRDLELLKAGNYTAESAGLLDMFPCKAHFEFMTVLRRGEL